MKYRATMFFTLRPKTVSLLATLPMKLQMYSRFVQGSLEVAFSSQQWYPSGRILWFAGFE